MQWQEAGVGLSQRLNPSMFPSSLALSSREQIKMRVSICPKKSGVFEDEQAHWTVFGTESWNLCLCIPRPYLCSQQALSGQQHLPLGYRLIIHLPRIGIASTPWVSLTVSHQDIMMGLGVPRSLPSQDPTLQQAHTPSTCNKQRPYAWSLCQLAPSSNP